jgi:hypothetical protein
MLFIIMVCLTVGLACCVKVASFLTINTCQDLMPKFNDQISFTDDKTKKHLKGTKSQGKVARARAVGAWQQVAINSLKFPPCPTLLRPMDRPPLKRPYGRFRGGPLAERAVSSRFLPVWTPHAVRL